MKPSLLRTLLPALALAALALPAGAQQIQRWVDQHGVVHFSDTPPAPGESASSPVTQITPMRPMTAAEKARAEQNMSQYRQALASPPPAPAASAPASAPQPQLPQGNSCADQWARFNAAATCMGPYRVAGGGLKPEAYQKCPQVPQPTCPQP